MSVAIALPFPETEDQFEAMCHQLYGLMWDDPGCMRVGEGGQAQYGVDILGNKGAKSIGVQCKHYVRTAFTLATVTGDIAKVEKANLEIDHLLFATTAPSKSKLVKDIHELSSKRRKEGKFTVSVDFWGDITGHIQMHPKIGRAFIPGFPGAPLLAVEETTKTHLDLYSSDREVTQHFQTEITGMLESLQRQLSHGIKTDAVPAARGDEEDPRVVASLDFIRDKLREGKSREAKELLESLGDPEQFTDKYSRFRWHTNQGAVDLLEGRYEEAADRFLLAFSLAPDNEKALINRAHALLLMHDPASSLSACDEGLSLFPANATLWAIKLHALRLLGESAPESMLPEEVRDKPDLLFARAHLCDSRGDFSCSTTLLRQCLDTEAGSLDAKRAYLASSIIWATTDPVLAHHGQLTKEQRDSLSDAVQRFEPLEQFLPALQSDHVSIELTNNISVALLLLGQIKRARTIATLSLTRHPLEEGLLRIKLNELDECKDFTGIHALTDSRLLELPAPILGVLAEISANHGDIDWHAAVMAVARESDMDLPKLQQLEVLAFHAQWMGGHKASALESVRAYLGEHPGEMLTRTLYGGMLRELGRLEEAKHEALHCVGLLSRESSSLDVLQVAELLYDLHEFREASRIYSRLVDVPGDNDLTRRLLICFIESDQRRKAQDLLDQLEPGVKELPRFRRIEANLARLTGDWARMAELLRTELARSPENLSIAIGFVGALHRLGDEASVHEYLASDPCFKDSSPENEFEFAKYQASYGLDDLAIARLYRQYRANPGSTQAASFYLGQVLLAQHFDALAPPTIVGPGSVVHLRTAGDTRTLAIDKESTKGGDGWPELVSPDSDLASNVKGLHVGDKVALAGAFGIADAEVVQIENLYRFAAQKAHEQVAAAASPAGPLWSVRVIKENGQLDIDLLLKATQQRSAQVKRAFENYQQHRFPVSMLAKSIGTDVVTLLLEWPFKVATFFVAIGTHEERDAAISVLQEKKHRYVLDLLTIAELVRHKSFLPILSVIGRPLIPQTVREHLLILIQLADGPRASGVLGEHDGRLQLLETPAEYFEHRKFFLEEMLRCLDEHCEVVPTIGPQEVTDLHNTIAELVDNDVLDVLYLCLEREAVLVSEDAGLRLWAVGVGVQTSMGIQPLLMEACEQKALSEEDYADALLTKVATGHDFISIRATDLLVLARRTPAQVSSEVKALLETFRRPTLDIVSGVRVSCEFLGLAIRKLQPRVAATYGDILLGVLQHNRSQLAGEIHRAIAHTVNDALSRFPRKLRWHEKHAFQHVLHAPDKELSLPRLTPLALTIRSLFRR